MLRVVVVGKIFLAASVVMVPMIPESADAELGLPAAGNSQRIAALQKFSLGSHSTCVTRADAYPVCWGLDDNNSFGNGWRQTERGDSPSEMGGALPRTVATSSTGAFYRRATAVFSGGDQTCILDTDSILRCVGTALNGSLGRSDGLATAGAGYSFAFNDSNIVNPGTGRSVVDVAPGGSSPRAGSGGVFNCALLDNGSVKCWGTNTNGQLGLGDTNHRGDQTGEMGDALPAVDLGTGVTATAIAAGFNFACAIVGGGSVPSGSVKCWGANGDGQLGQGDANARGDGANEMGDSLPAVNIGAGRTAKMIVAGNTYVCVIRDNDSVVCWGANASHQLGRDGNSVTAPNDKIGDGANEMGNNLVAVNLGQGASLLGAGGSHVCALLVDSVSVKCWGANFSGQLGQGDTVNRGSSTAPMSSLAPVDLGLVGNETVAVVAAGGSHTCVYTSTEQVKCWGDNGRGQLGIGQATSVRIGDASGEMGVNLAAVDYAATSPSEVLNIVSTSTPTSVTFSWDAPSHSFGTITAYEASCGSRGSFGGTWNGTNTGWTSLALQRTVSVTSTSWGNVATEGLIECQIRARTISGATGEGLTMRAGRRAGTPLVVTASSHTVTVGASVPTITGTPSVNGVSRTGETCTTTYTPSSPAGTYPTTCSGGTASGYSVDYVAGVITAATPLTVTASSHALTAGATVPTITGTPSVNGVSRTGETCTTTYTPSSPAGTYPTTCSGGTASGYSITYVPGSITVATAPTTTTSTPAPATSGISVSGSTTSLVTPANQSALTATPGKAAALVNGVAVTPQIVTASNSAAAQADPTERTPEQVRELQQAATVIETRLDTIAGGDSGVSVVRTETGAVMTGIFSGTRVPVEDVVVVNAADTATLFAARDVRGNIIEVKPGAVLEVAPNGDVAVQAFGLRSGERVELVVMSTPTLLGNYTVDAKGTIKTTAKLPTTIGTGNHSLVVASPSVKASLGLKLVKSNATLPITGSTYSTDLTNWAVAVLLSGVYVMMATRSRRRSYHL